MQSIYSKELAETWASSKEHKQLEKIDDLTKPEMCDSPRLKKNKNRMRASLDNDMRISKFKSFDTTGVLYKHPMNSHTKWDQVNYLDRSIEMAKS